MNERQVAAQLLQQRRRARTNFEQFNIAVCPPGEEPVDHHRVICTAYDKLIARELQRIMLFMPPGTAKTTYATIRGPAYWLGRMQGKRKGIITASNTQKLADAFGRRVRNLVNSPEYQAVFPGVRLQADQTAKGEWETRDGSFYFAAGVLAAIAGRRGDLGVIDDPVKTRKDADSPTTQAAVWDWYLSDFLSRLKPDTAQQLLIGTRWNENDLFGMILPENWNGESGMIHCRDRNDWLVICMPAEATDINDPLGRQPGEWLWPQFFNPEYWEQMKATQLAIPRNWYSLYQQVPAAVEGNMFKQEHVQYYNRAPKHLNLYMTGDFAVTDDDGADFTELAVWGVDPHGDVYALAWWHGQEEMDVWVEELLDLAEAYKPLYFGGESGPIRRAVEPYLKKRMRERKVNFSLEWFSHSENTKVGDARSFLAMWNMNRVYWPVQCEWAERVIRQLKKFPAGARDDAVDTCSLLGRLLELVWSATEKKEESPEKVVVKKDAPLVMADFMQNPRKQRGDGW